MKKSFNIQKNGRIIEENPVMILNSIARLFDARVRATNPVTDMLPHGSRRILMHLAREDGIPQMNLVELTHLSAPTVSLGLKKMEEMGLVKRENDKNDARVTKVYLTDKGKALDEENFLRLQEIDKLVMRGLDDEEITRVTEILIKMRKNLLEDE